jgi:hypothetical protein
MQLNNETVELDNACTPFLNPADTCFFSAMSATFRLIDLVTKALAPLVTGQVMTYASTIYGAIFIGSWNIGAFFIEYWLLGIVYRMNPKLHVKGSLKYGMYLHSRK